MVEGGDRGTRFFLRRLRESMALALPEEEKLKQIVTLISGHMVAEVCSIYWRRPDGRMELHASQGLNPTAVHQTILAPREGLVGEIVHHARPLTLDDAQAHPAFSYHPETGEKIYKSFLGVPIVRMGHVVGVLAVQNRRSRSYKEEETELLETVAMLLAERMVAGGDAREMQKEARDDAHDHYQGTALAEGVALGNVFFHEPRVNIDSWISEDPGLEHRRLDSAIYDLRAKLDKMLETADVSDGLHREVLESFRMFADDRGWINNLHEAVETGLTAEAAVERVQENIRARFLHQSNPYLRERLHDLDDLANRLLRHLTGAMQESGKIPQNSILFARNMGPAELLDYDRPNLRGIVLEEGSPQAHVTIVARALEIPLLGNLPNILNRTRLGDPVILDGHEGTLHIRPGKDLVHSYREKIRLNAKRRQHYIARAHEPARTKDGKDVSLLMVAGLLVDLPHLAESGAEGIGLFRTELQFMIHATMPRLQEQEAFYRQVYDAAQDRPVIFRTLDIGGDKILPYMSQLGARARSGENPSLGWRAIRIALDKPALLRYQLRAFLSAAKGRHLQILFPMIATLDEFLRARQLLDKEIAHAKRHRKDQPQRISVGAMLEVPSLLWQMEALLPHLDFLSIGTNDLAQFFFASDRSDPHMSARYDPLDRSFLRMLYEVCQKADKAGVPVTICGEMAGFPLEALALVGLGFRRLGLSPTAIGPVKDAIRASDAAALQEKMKEICKIGSAQERISPRALLEDFAKKNRIPL